MQPSQQNSDRTIIIGGGLAGIAAAQAMASVGIPATLLESRPRLGGRATSFDDKQTGQLLDNCQHVSMGCCTNLEKLCRELGIENMFEAASELTFIDTNGQKSRFAASHLPAPFHLAHAFAGLKHFTWPERFEIALGLKRLASERRFDGPFLHWLFSAGQGERVRRLFWHVVLVSALSESLDRIATQAARKVFVEGFFSHPRAWEVLIPKAPLDDLYGAPVIKALQSRNVDVRLKTAVDSVSVANDGTFQVALRNRETLTASRCIVAVAHHRVADILDQRLAKLAPAVAAAALEPAPITSVHLWFDRSLTELPHAVFVDHLSQWMFRKPTTTGQHYYQIVISASHEIGPGTHDAVVAEVCRDLQSAFPAAVDAKLVHSRVVAEKRAVFAPTPTSQRTRPAQRSSRAGLYFAGDWTQTGWPSTMEGAVRSGFLAAEAVMQDTGNPKRFLAPDLKPTPLARLLGFS